MAYLNYLASVPQSQIDSIQTDPGYTLQPTAVETVSHLIGYWVKLQPLGSLLGETLDRGNVLSGQLWHPLRVPVYHPAESVARLFQSLSTAWQEATAIAPVDATDWYRIEIEKVMAILQKASVDACCIVSVLSPPFDSERGDRVRIPFLV